jgi:hypothetical protein
MSNPFPGKINYKDTHGCLAEAFHGEPQAVAAQMNAFFEKNNNALVAEILPVAPSLGNAGGLVVLYTIVLDEDTRQLMNDRAQLIEEMLAEKRDKRKADEQASADAAAKADAEMDRLASLGREYEKTKEQTEKTANDLRVLKAKMKKYLTNEQREAWTKDLTDAD